MMIVIKDRTERLRHMSDNLRLRYQVQCSVLDKLQYVWRSIRSVKIHIPLLLANKSLVTQRLKIFPRVHEIFYHVNIWHSVSNKITGVEKPPTFNPGINSSGLYCRSLALVNEYRNDLYWEELLH